MYCLCAVDLRVSIIRCFVLGLEWTHILSWFWWCGLSVCGPSLFCPTDRFGLPGFVCRMCEASIATYLMDISYGDGPLGVYEDDYRRMQPSNDLNQDKLVDLWTLGVVDLDTSISPDVFGLRAPDSQEPVVRMLPGDFRNLACVLVRMLRRVLWAFMI